MGKPVKLLVRIRHGSHLYGTSTPASDQDYKSVHLPSGDAIILCRPEDHIDRTVKISTSVKNTKDDVDDTSYSLQKWLDMLAKGDTVGTEILFADEANIVEMAPEWPLIRDAAWNVLNRQCKGFVGYCRQQANKYGIKGSRMATAKALVSMLQHLLGVYGTTARLGDVERHLRPFCETHEFADIVNIPSQAGTDVLHLDALGRKAPFTSTIKSAHDIYAKVYENYGERARAAMTNQGIDWKAISHAVRVARQATELLTTGHITFPRPDALELLSIKLGERPFAEVGALLEDLVEQVENAASESALPEETDRRYVDCIVRHHYLGQVTA